MYKMDNSCKIKYLVVCLPSHNVIKLIQFTIFVSCDYHNHQVKSNYLSTYFKVKNHNCVDTFLIFCSKYYEIIIIL